MSVASRPVATPAGSEGLGRSVRNTLREMKKYWFAYVFISPFYINFLVFTVFSLIYSFYVSFYHWDGMRPMVSAGFGNYLELAQDKVFLESVKNTILMMLMDYPAQIVAPLVVAAVLNSPIVKAKGLFRTAYYIPNYTSTVVITFVFQILFMTRKGLVNFFLGTLGIPPVAWLTDGSWARVTIVLLALWRDLGFRMMIYLAGLQSIPTDLYEAAVVDGATPVQSFFKITVPMLRPVILFVMITTTIGSVQRFIEPLLLTEGGPGYATHTILYWLYLKAFTSLRLGYASAMGYALFVAIAILSLVQLKLGASYAEE